MDIDDKGTIQNASPDDENEASREKEAGTEQQTVETSSGGGWMSYMSAIYQTVRTRIAPKAVEFLTGEVAPRALYILKTLLQDVPNDIDFSDSDSDWPECRLEESDVSDKESDNEDSQDTDQQTKVSRCGFTCQCNRMSNIFRGVILQ